MTNKNDIRIVLIEHIEFVQKKMSEIEALPKLTIHEMADLERYSSTLRNLAESYKSLN